MHIVYVYIYIYTYMHTERERERDRDYADDGDPTTATGGSCSSLWAVA